MALGPAWWPGERQDAIDATPTKDAGAARWLALDVLFVATKSIASQAAPHPQAPHLDY